MRALITLFALLAALTIPQLAAAQNHLQDAEAAYVEVDFDATLAASQSAIDSGALNPTELARAYELLGVSAAALGDPDSAREVFLRMLSIDPERRLDDTVPPRLRAPFLEARGIVSARPDRMAAEVTLVRVHASLRIAIVDPYEMVERVRLHMRSEGQAEYETFEAPYGAEILAPFAGASGSGVVEYWLELVDPRGNEVVVVGSEFAPDVLGRSAVSAGGGAVGPAGPSIFEEPVFWIIVGSVIAVGAGVGIAVGVVESNTVGIQTTISF